MVGGGKEDKSIHCAISGLKYSNTPLGEKDGRTTPRVEKLSIILDKANLKPTNKPRENCLKLLFFAEVEKKKKL